MNNEETAEKQVAAEETKTKKPATKKKAQKRKPVIDSVLELYIEDQGLDYDTWIDGEIWKVIKALATDKSNPYRKELEKTIVGDKKLEAYKWFVEKNK